MDTSRFDFKNIKTTGVADAQGDKAFDAEDFAVPGLPGLQVVTA
jgi:tRNA 2-thiocytidine biosynthesis protein TtcA